MRTSDLIAGVLISMVGTSYLPAQDAEPSTRKPNSRFEKTSPAIGQPVPDITIYKEDGSEFDLGELKGTYSVIIFGCLT